MPERRGRNLLLEDINKQAAATWTGPELTKDNIEEQIGPWVRHWIATGEKMRDALRQEGLMCTAAAIHRHVEFQKRYLETTQAGYKR